MNFVSLPLIVVIVNIAIGCTLLEAAFLLLVHHRSGRGLHPKEYLLNLLSGLCLMLALRCALAAAWALVPLFLMASGAVHGYDIALRLRGTGVLGTDRRAQAPLVQTDPR